LLIILCILQIFIIIERAASHSQHRQSVKFFIGRVLVSLVAIVVVVVK